MSDLAHRHPAAVERPTAGGDAASALDESAARPSGPAAAVLLAAGISASALGVLTVLTALSSSVSSALTLSDRVGDLSGVTTLTALVFFGAWAGLGFAWRRADPPLTPYAVAGGVLTALGLACTFPPFLNAIGA